MDGSVMGPTMYSGPGEGGIEVEPLTIHHHSPFSHPPHHHHQAYVHHLQGLAPLSTTQHINAAPDAEQVTSKPILICSKGKSAGSSDEDEPSLTEDGVDGGMKSKKDSPWHRMKWTDSMVKLLINIVLIVGEDGALDGADGSNKRKCGVLQKKGKWKSVSRLMMDRGCFVSPQQCEDKFNDLNKRYKRLNEILGKETACCVVESPAILDTMDMPQKTKEDVKKILSSKHLFYKEMCFYHSGCKPVASFDLDFQPSIQVGIMGKGVELMDAGRLLKDENEMDDEDEVNGDDEVDGDSDDEDDDHDEQGADAKADRMKNSPFGKHRRTAGYEGNFSSFSDYTQRFGMDATNNNLTSMMMAGGLKLTAEQWQWMSIHMLQIEEQKVAFLAQALELEKQRFKWQKLCSRKDRENERLRIETERTKLENERMSLQMKQKELEIEFKRSEASISSIALILERLQPSEQKDSGRGQGMYASS